MLEFKLVQTCMACPEQYDAYFDGVKVAYLRLRHGHFYVQFPYDGQVIYEADPKGDGCFDDDERGHYLGEAVRAILEVMKDKINEDYNRIIGDFDSDLAITG